MNPGLTPLFWFFGVIALIPLVLWMIKRSPMGSGLVQGPVRQVGVMPLSTTQRLVTIEVGQGDDRLWLVLGVTPNSISTLHTMVPGPSVPGLSTGAIGGGAGSLAAVTPQTTFAQLLQRMQGRGPDAR